MGPAGVRAATSPGAHSFFIWPARSQVWEAAARLALTFRYVRVELICNALCNARHANDHENKWLCHGTEFVIH